MTTTNNEIEVVLDSEITDKQIINLRTAAGEHGDTEQVAICDVALTGEVGERTPVDAETRASYESKGRDWARAECARVLES